MSDKQFKEIEMGNVWQFEKEGDCIEGEYVGKQPGSYGDNYKLKCESGEEFVVFGSTVLNTKMALVKEGSFIKVTYLGEVKSGNGRLYKDYKVEVAE